MAGSPDGELRGLIRRIEETFGHDIDAWLTCFEMPMVLVAPPATIVLTDVPAAREQFLPMFETLKEQGFASTAAERVDVRAIGDDLALVDAHFTRRRLDGSILEQLAAMYVCRLTTAGWRVAVLVRHPYGVPAVGL